MIRRRRRAREIIFGFDSFLDIVANVVGIIIRMILVVWVGARSYTSLQLLNRPAPPPAAVEAVSQEDPLQRELEQRRRELADAQARLMEQLRQVGLLREGRVQGSRALACIDARRQAFEAEKAALDRPATEQPQIPLEDLRERSRRLREEIAALERQPSASQALRYRTPVSRPVQSEELIFECRGGRVAFIDVEALLQEVRRGMREKADLLRSRWQVSDVTPAVGPFRLRYTVERESGAGLPVPDGQSGFRYGVGSWAVEPIVPVRGETAEAALASGSEFRQIVDVLDPQQTVVTFCVYPDSFTLYRRLREYLHQREVEVAGRPLPAGIAIAGSRHGTLSRGQ